MKLKVGVALVCVLLLAQLFPVNRENPPVESEVPASAEVRRVLRSSCYDCHSHETRWPWYSRAAPFSWLVAHDVSHAREHLNFSAWNRYDAREQRISSKKSGKRSRRGRCPSGTTCRSTPRRVWPRTTSDGFARGPWKARRPHGQGAQSRPSRCPSGTCRVPAPPCAKRSYRVGYPARCQARMWPSRSRTFV